MMTPDEIHAALLRAARGHPLSFTIDLDQTDASERLKRTHAIAQAALKRPPNELIVTMRDPGLWDFAVDEDGFRFDVCNRGVMLYDRTVERNTPLIPICDPIKAPFAAVKKIVGAS